MRSKTSETSESVCPVSRGQYGSRERGVGITRLLSERDVDINAQDENHTFASSSSQSNFGSVQIAQVLLDSDHGANINAGNNEGKTSLYQGLQGEYHVQLECDSPGITKCLF
jgi:hypothetical protein